MQKSIQDFFLTPSELSQSEWTMINLPAKNKNESRRQNNDSLLTLPNRNKNTNTNTNPTSNPTTTKSNSSAQFFSLPSRSQMTTNPTTTQLPFTLPCREKCVSGQGGDEDEDDGDGDDGDGDGDSGGGDEQIDGDDTDTTCEIHLPLPPLSHEQQAVVDSVCQTQHHTTVIAKAGCGKTTTALALAAQFFEQFGQRTLILTYNANLKQQVRNRIQTAHLSGAVEAHSYHAAALRFFLTCQANTQRFRITHKDDDVYNSLQIKHSQQFAFGVVVIDEAQDLKPLFVEFIKHLLQHMSSPPLLVIFGDPFQHIYGYQQASCEYLSDPSAHFFNHLADRPWTTLHLNISYRISHEMADFVNNHLNPSELRHIVDPAIWEQHSQQWLSWWGDGIHASPNRSPEPKSVRYQHVDMYSLQYKSSPNTNNKRVAMQELNDLIHLIQSVGRSKVTILSRCRNKPNSKTPLSLLSERLSNAGIAMFSTGEEDSVSRNKTTQSKLVMSTIHQYKGMENDVVLVVGLDAYNEKKVSSHSWEELTSMYNLFYVAATRAKQQLIVWRHNPHEFVTMRKCSLNNQHCLPPTKFPCGVRDLCRHVCFDAALDINQQILNVTQLPSPLLTATPILNDNKTRSIKGLEPNTCEDLAMAIGVVIELMIQKRINEHPINVPSSKTIFESFNRDRISAREVSAFCDELRERAEWSDWDLMRFAIASVAWSQGYIHLWRQLNTEYLRKWFEKYHSSLLECVDRVRVMLHSLSHQSLEQDWSVFAHRLQMWKPTYTHIPWGWFTNVYHPAIRGEIDMILDGRILIELKIASEYHIEHAHQAQLYAAQQTFDLFFGDGNSNLEQPNIEQVVVMLPNLNEMHQVKFALSQPPKLNSQPSGVDPHIWQNFAFLYRMLRRKRLCHTIGDEQTQISDWNLFVNSMLQCE